MKQAAFLVATLVAGYVLADPAPVAHRCWTPASFALHAEMQTSPVEADVTMFRLGLAHALNHDVSGLDLVVGVGETDGDAIGLQFGGLATFAGGDAIGLQLGGFVGFSRGDALGMQFGGLLANSYGDAIGLQIGGLASLAGFEVFKPTDNGEEAPASAPGGDVFGMQFGGLGASARGDMDGLQVGGIWCLAKGDAIGLQASGIWSEADGDAIGLQVSGIWSETGGDAIGLQIGGLTARAKGDVAGLQIGGPPPNLVYIGCAAAAIAGIIYLEASAGGDGSLTAAGMVGCFPGPMQPEYFFSTSCKTLRGAQIGVANLADRVMGTQIGVYSECDLLQGAQLGVVNRAERVEGVQIGVYNECDSLCGIQLGLVNRDSESSEPYLPFIRATF